MLFTDRVEKHLPPRKSRAHALRIVREVLARRPMNPGTSLAAALTELNRVQRRRAVVFLISDFLDDGFEKPLRVAARRHDVIAVGVSDPWEESPPAGVRLLLEDAESGAPARMKLPAPLSGDRWRSLERALGRAGADTLLLRTDRALAGPLLGFFRRRERRSR